MVGHIYTYIYKYTHIYHTAIGHMSPSGSRGYGTESCRGPVVRGLTLMRFCHIVSLNYTISLDFNLFLSMHCLVITSVQLDPQAADLASRQLQFALSRLAGREKYG